MKLFLSFLFLMSIGGIYMVAHFIIPDYREDMGRMKSYTKTVKDTRRMRVENPDTDSYKDSVDVPVVDFTDGSRLIFSGDGEKYWPEIEKKALPNSKMKYYPRVNGTAEYNPLQVEINGDTIYSRESTREMKIIFCTILLLPSVALFYLSVYYLKRKKLQDLR